MTRTTDVVVIGGGQAGLAAGYHLRRLGLDFVILDAQAESGGARQHAWDSLHLFSPAAYSSLPGRLMPPQPGATYKVFARMLDAATVRFDLVNYAGPCGAVKVYGPRRMAPAFDRVTGSLERRLDKEPEADLARAIHYPVRWDPYVQDYMTLVSRTT